MFYGDKTARFSSSYESTFENRVKFPPQCALVLQEERSVLEFPVSRQVGRSDRNFSRASPTGDRHTRAGRGRRCAF